MRSFWKEDVSRRAVLKWGAAGAVALTAPWPTWRTAEAANGSPHFLVVIMGDGGWDPTQVFDVHDPNDSTDGIDVDVPGQPASVAATVSGLTYLSNPVTRPTVDTFFQNWASRSAIVNGVATRSTSHSQSRQLVLTGYLDATRADFAVMSAHNNGRELPLPHLLLNGTSFAGPFAGMSGRLGGQMGTAVAYNRLENNELAVSGLGEAYIQQALAFQRQLDTGAASGAITGRLNEFQDGMERGDMLAQLSTTLNINSNNGTQLATTLGDTFRSGLTTSVTASRVGGFDTHNDNTVQSTRFESLFTFVNDFVTGLSAQTGVVASSLLDETTVIVCSEFGRTPKLNNDGGKDHHPWTSLLLVGKNVRPGVTVGMTDGDQEGVKTNYDTGQPDDNGQIIDVTNMVAGILTLMGANPNSYLPAGVQPLTAFVNA